MGSVLLCCVMSYNWHYATCTCFYVLSDCVILSYVNCTFGENYTVSENVTTLCCYNFDIHGNFFHNKIFVRLVGWNVKHILITYFVT